VYKLDIVDRYLFAVRSIYSVDDLGGEDFLFAIYNSLKESGINTFLKSRSIPKSVIDLFKKYIYSLKNNKLNSLYDFFDSRNRLNIFKDVLFLMTKNESKNQGIVKIISAIALQNDELDGIKELLIKLIGNIKYDFELSIDGRLIAGYKIYYNGKCLDLSHKSRVMKVKNVLQNNLFQLKLEDF